MPGIIALLMRHLLRTYLTLRSFQSLIIKLVMGNKNNVVFNHSLYRRLSLDFFSWNLVEVRGQGHAVSFRSMCEMNCITECTLWRINRVLVVVQYLMSDKANVEQKEVCVLFPHTCTVSVIKLNQHIDIRQPRYQLRGVGTEVCSTFRAVFNWCSRFCQKSNLVHSCSLLCGPLLIAWSWQFRCIQHSMKPILKGKYNSYARELEKSYCGNEMSLIG